MEGRAWKRGRAWIAWGLAAGSLGTMAPAAIAGPAWIAEKALTDPQTKNCFEFPFGSGNYICSLSSLQPDVALAGDGALRVAWTPNVSSSTSAMTLQRPAGGAYSSSDELAAGASAARVGMAEDGEAVAAWSNGGNIEVAFAPPGGAFGSSSTLVSASQLLDLDVAANGAAIATFEQGSSPNVSVNVSYRPPGGSFGTAEPVSATSVDFNEVSTVIDATGDALVGWARSDGTSYVPEVRFRPASGPPDPMVQALGAGVNTSGLRLAMNDDGDAAAIWFGASDYVAHARYRPAGGSWGTEAPLSGGDVVGVEVAVDDAGNVLALWSRVPSGTAVTEWSFRPSGGSFSPAATFPGGLGAVPDVEFWPGGDALAVWSAPNSHVLNSAIRPAGGSWATPISVLDALTARPIVSAKLATDPAGNAAVTWVEYQGGSTSTETDQAFLKGFDGAPPVLRNVTVPGSAQPGQTVNMSASASDVWSSTGPVKWDFGDGDTTTGKAVQHAYAAVGDYEVEVSSTDGLGQKATLRRTVHVSTNAGTGPDGGGPGGADLGAAVIRRFHLTHEVFRVARRKTPVTVSAKVHRGTKFVFKSSEAGRAKFTIQQRKRGHWRTRKPKLKRPVTKGKNKVRFTGRYGDRKLKPGRYRVKLRVKDADGNKSAVKKARFRIVR